MLMSELAPARWALRSGATATAAATARVAVADADDRPARAAAAAVAGVAAGADAAGVRAPWPRRGVLLRGGGRGGPRCVRRDGPPSRRSCLPAFPPLPTRGPPRACPPPRPRRPPCCQRPPPLGTRRPRRHGWPHGDPRRHPRRGRASPPPPPLWSSAAAAGRHRAPPQCRGRAPRHLRSRGLRVVAGGGRRGRCARPSGARTLLC